MKRLLIAAAIAGGIALTGCTTAPETPSPAPSPSVSCTTLDLTSDNIGASREQGVECFQYLTTNNPERARSVMELVEVPAEDELGHKTSDPTDEHSAQATVLRIEHGLRADATRMPVTYETASTAQDILKGA